MDIKVLRSFEKDIESINSKAILKRITELVENMEVAATIVVCNLKNRNNNNITIHN
jgi:hypothetical protein